MREIAAHLLRVAAARKFAPVKLPTAALLAEPLTAYAARPNCAEVLPRLWLEALRLTRRLLHIPWQGERALGSVRGPAARLLRQATSDEGTTPPRARLVAQAHEARS